SAAGHRSSSTTRASSSSKSQKLARTERFAARQGLSGPPLREPVVLRARRLHGRQRVLQEVIRGGDRRSVGALGDDNVGGRPFPRRLTERERAVALAPQQRCSSVGALTRRTV